MVYTHFSFHDWLSVSVSECNGQQIILVSDSLLPPSMSRAISLAQEMILSPWIFHFWLSPPWCSQPTTFVPASVPLPSTSKASPNLLTMQNPFQRQRWLSPSWGGYCIILAPCSLPAISSTIPLCLLLIINHCLPKKIRKIKQKVQFTFE